MKLNKLKSLLISTCCLVTIISQSNTMEMNSTQDENLKNSRTHSAYKICQRIELPNRRLNDENIYVLSKLISENELITRINLNYNNFGDKGLLYLANILPNFINLTELHLYGAKSDGSGTMAIINASIQMPNLKTVDTRTLVNTLNLMELCSDHKKFMVGLEFLPDDDIIKSLTISSYDNSNTSTPH